MDLKEETVKLFKDIGASFVDQEWASNVWDLDFSDDFELPSNFVEKISSENIVELHGGLSKICRKWASIDVEATDLDSLWNILRLNDICIKAHVTIIHGYVYNGTLANARNSDKMCSIYASDSYISLISTTGSRAFNMFHPLVFQRCLDVINLWPCEMKSRKRKVKDKESKSKKICSRDINSDGDSDDIEEFEEYEQIKEPSTNVISNNIIRFMRNLVHVLESFSLKGSGLLIEHLVILLANVVRSNSCAHFPNLSEPILIDRETSVAVISFKLLYNLCSGYHGNELDCCKTVFMNLLPSLLMLGDNGNSYCQNIPAYVVQCKDSSFKFISAFVSNEVTKSAVVTLIQHVAVKVPDKAEYRLKVSEGITHLCNKLDYATFQTILRWIGRRLSQSSKPGNRGFAVDLCACLFSSLKLLESDDLYILKILIGRSNDKSPTVRGRSLALLNNILSFKKEHISSAFLDLYSGEVDVTGFLIDVEDVPRLQNEVPSAVTENGDLQEDIVENEHHEGPNKFTSLKEIFSLRLLDERSSVRKAVIQTLEAAYCLKEPTTEDLDTLLKHCRDPALSVRKQCIECLTNILKRWPESKHIHENWLHGILPLIIDCEQSVVEKVAGTLEDIILNQIKGIDHSSSHVVLCWSLLDSLSKAENYDFSRYLQKTFLYWSQHSKLKVDLIKNLSQHATVQDHKHSSWMVLACATIYTRKIDSNMIEKFWNLVSSSSENVLITRQILEVTGNVGNCLNCDVRKQVLHSLKGDISAYRLSVEVLSSACDTFTKLLKVGLSCEQTGRDLIHSECKEILYKSHADLSTALYTTATLDFSEVLVVKQLFTLGEMSQRVPGKISSRIPLLVQTFLLASPDNNVDRYFSTRPPTQIAHFNDTMSQLSQETTSMLKCAVSSTVRAHALIALGKMCLQNESLAKMCVAALAREMEVTTDHVSKSNILIILSDLCIRYTLLVDRYVPLLSLSLKDPVVYVRKHAFILLTHLLQEDYIKWKGSLFYRFIVITVDDNDEVSKFADYCLTQVLLKRNPDVMFQHFLETIFVFNNYTGYLSFNNFHDNSKAGELFSLNDSPSKRYKLYDYMLDHMTDSHRFRVSEKICNELIGPIVDESIIFDDSSAVLLKDAFYILLCKNIKLQSLSKNFDEDIEADEGAGAAGSIQTDKDKATVRFISAIRKKTFVEVILPYILSLKKMLEKVRHPLLKDVMNYLQEFVKNEYYKTEIEDVFAGNRLLSEEIKYDLKKLEDRRSDHVKIREVRREASVVAEPETVTEVLKKTMDKLIQLKVRSRIADTEVSVSDSNQIETFSMPTVMMESQAPSGCELPAIPRGRRGCDMSTPMRGTTAPNITVNDVSAISSPIDSFEGTVLSEISTPAKNSQRRERRNPYLRVIKEERC